MTLTKSGILGPALPWGNEDVEVEDGGKEADEKEDRKDNAAILLLQLCLLLWVSADYSFLLERPKGGFVCQWSYIASIVM